MSSITQSTNTTGALAENASESVDENSARGVWERPSLIRLDVTDAELNLGWLLHPLAAS